MSPVIDFEHHYVPREVIEATNEEMTEIISGKFDYNRKVQFCRGLPASRFKHIMLDDRVYDIDGHIRAMDQSGIDISVLTATAAWHANLDACKLVNDLMAEAVNKYPRRLVALAHVPPLEGEPAIQEIRRAVGELGHKGVAIPCFVEGRNLDSRDLWPFYEAMSSMKLPIFIHPSLLPSRYELVPDSEYELHRAFVREFDVLTSVVRLALGGVLEAFPDIKIVVCHFGSGISAMKERIERWEFTFDVPRCFGDGFKKLYFATSGYDVSTIALRSALMGIGPERLVFATDYPYDFRGGGPHLRAWVQQIKGLPLSVSEKDRILGGTAAELLGIGN